MRPWMRRGGRGRGAGLAVPPGGGRREPRDCRGPGVRRGHVGDRLVLAVRGRPPGHPESGRAPPALRRTTPRRAARPGPRLEPLSTALMESPICVHPPRLHVRGLRLFKPGHVPPPVRGGRILRVGPCPPGPWTGRG